MNRRLILTLAGIAAAAVVTGTVALSVAWRDRPSVDELGWPIAPPAADAVGRVTVTWLGIGTLLFDDGETQILTDGTFTRLSLTDLLSLWPVSSDLDAINHGLSKHRLDRLAAIVPLHSHFDHAMDAGHVANRTSAIVLGSESTANIARGAGVPVHQHQTLANGESRQFGDFTITLIESRHAPLGPGDRPPFPGTIDEPLTQPARVRDWREGMTWSVLVAHPQGSALIQGSGGFIPEAVPENSADVVMLGIAGLSGLGRKWVEDYWRETVLRTGAGQVYPIHFEDFTRSSEEILLFPRIVDDMPRTAAWLNELAENGPHSLTIRRLPLDQPVQLFAEP